MKTKVEIQQFPSGHYGIVRTMSGWFGNPLVHYLDVSSSSSSSNKWKAPGEYTGGCFHTDIKKMQGHYTESGYAPGIPIIGAQLFDIEDIVAMNEMAVNDEGLRDLMLKAKEFFLLKKK